MKEILCKCCGKIKAQFTKGVGYCQHCYRDALEEYSFYDYKFDKKKMNETGRKICEMLIEQGIDRKEIHKILGLNSVYVQQIIKKYTKRVNSEGKERPF